MSVRAARPLLLVGLLLAALALAAIARAEIDQKGEVRVNFEGKLTPSALPRSGDAPVRVAVSAKVTTASGDAPPAMRQMSIAINRYGRLDTTGLPVCRLEKIQPATTDDALAACRRSLIGEGRFSADVPDRGGPFPSEGKIYAFNGELGCSPAEATTGRLWPSTSRTQGVREGERASLPGRGSSGGRSPVVASLSEREQRTGDLSARDLNPRDRGQRDARCQPRPAILAHVYGVKPAPASFTMAFVISRSKGTFGTTLSADLPPVKAGSGAITGISLSLGKNFTAAGKRHSLFSGTCPAPQGVRKAGFKFARASVAFAAGPTLSTTLNRACTALG